jgi:DNA-binding LacI/PurR family transcriptional regulator
VTSSPYEPDPAGIDPAAESRRRSVLMTDVARLAGVSHQTVSRVLNEPSRVRPQTRGRVQAAIDELGYRRSQTARALATGRRHTLGIVGFDTSLSGPAGVLFGIERYARMEGYSMVVASLEAHSRQLVAEAVEHLRNHDVEGIIVIAPPASATNLLRKTASDIGVVVVEGDPELGLPVVTIDEYYGAACATRHLLDLGHGTVWHVAGPRDWLGAAQLRERAWRETLEAAGVEVPPVLVGAWTARSGYEQGRVLASKAEVTAVFAANDQMALGVLRALHEQGRRVPEDVSVVGFDDIPEAAYFSPALTTVRQDFAEVGRRTFALLHEQITGVNPQPAPVIIPVDLVVRASTSRAPAGS